MTANCTRMFVTSWPPTSKRSPSCTANWTRKGCGSRMTTRATDDKLVVQWRGKQWDALHDTTHALDIEGALRASKTTIALWKELNAMLDQPGIHTILARWTEDATQSVLKPIWRAILAQA